MNITVLGAGAGGTTLAFDCAAHGHQVSLFDFPQFPDNIAAIAEHGGIHAEGDISGFNAIEYAGHDIDRALENSELVYVVGPAFSTEPFGEAVAGKLLPGQTVIVTPVPAAARWLSSGPQAWPLKTIRSVSRNPHVALCCSPDRARPRSCISQAESRESAGGITWPENREHTAADLGRVPYDGAG